MMPEQVDDAYQVYVNGGHVYATCFALRIDPEGNVELANARHLPPYLTGEEMELAGALPLGMAAEAEFTTMNFTLKQGDALLMMTDGVAEAQDAQGHLLGSTALHAWRNKQSPPLRWLLPLRLLASKTISLFCALRDRADAPTVAGAEFAEASMD